MNKSLSELLRKNVAEAESERWKQVQERHIFLKKLKKKKEKEVKLKLKLFYDNLQYKNDKYKGKYVKSLILEVCFM